MIEHLLPAFIDFKVKQTRWDRVVKEIIAIRHAFTRLTVDIFLLCRRLDNERLRKAEFREA